MKRIIAGLIFTFSCFSVQAQGSILTEDGRVIHPRDTLFSGRTWVDGLAEHKGQKRLDSLIYFSLDTSAGIWYPTYSTLYSYDDRGRLQAWLNRKWNNLVWLNQLLTRDYYEGEYTMAREQLSWNTVFETWQFYRLNLYQRDSAGNVLINTSQQWDAVENSWSDLSRRIMEYDTLGNRVLLIHQLPSDTGWYPYYRFLNIYDKYLQTDFYNQDWYPEDSEWVNREWVHYSYDPQGRAIEDLNHIWIISTGWYAQTRVSYSWNEPGYVSEKLYQTWDPSAGEWKNAVSYLYYQDKSGLDTLIVYRVAGSSGLSWRELKKYRYQYDEEADLITESWTEYDQLRMRWYGTLKAYYYYSGTQTPLAVQIIDSTSVSCHGYQDGSALAQASGGNPPYRYFWDDQQGTTVSLVTGLSGGRYYRVTVTDALLNTATDSLILQDPPPVVTGPLAGNPSPVQDDTLVYSVPEDVGSYYTWSVTGGEILEGQSLHQIRIHWTGSGTGLVKVTETSSKACPGDTAIMNILIIPLSVKDLIGEQDFILYPNPVHSGNAVTIRCDECRFDQVWITDLAGRILLRESWSSTREIRLHTETLPRGTYFVHAMGERNVTMKMVIQ